MNSDPTFSEQQKYLYTKPFGFPKWRRIHLQRDFENIFRNGTKQYGKYFTIWFLLSEQPLQIAIHVPRKIGRAVKRNRTKRLIREFIRHHWSLLPPTGQLIIRVNTLLFSWNSNIQDDFLDTISRAIVKFENKKTP
ncbi:MAG: ribonuclease P protein component [bacterium]|nr:ribonuclease P protein component [bacterium]